jgi:heme exporter protein D
VLTYFALYRMIVLYRTHRKHMLDALHRHRARRSKREAAKKEMKCE